MKQKLPLANQTIVKPFTATTQGMALLVISGVLFLVFISKESLAQSAIISILTKRLIYIGTALVNGIVFGLVIRCYLVYKSKLSPIFFFCTAAIGLLYFLILTYVVLVHFRVSSATLIGQLANWAFIVHVLLGMVGLIMIIQGSFLFLGKGLESLQTKRKKEDSSQEMRQPYP